MTHTRTPTARRRPDRAADTTMMGVVHDALRRDLSRLHHLLTGPTNPALDDARRQAVCDHIEWMMDFLHRHHRAEDDGLWPLLLTCAPEAAPLMADLERDHAAIGPAMQQVLHETSTYRNEPANRLHLERALTALSELLLPHLRREENEALPVVSAHLTDREWRAWDKQYNIRGKSLQQLAMDGHWLMDGLDPDRYQHLIHLVPAPVRLFIVKGFARSYQRACAARWTPDIAVTSRRGPA